jgi:hypothetical protein
MITVDELLVHFEIVQVAFSSYANMLDVFERLLFQYNGFYYSLHICIC